MAYGEIADVPEATIFHNRQALFRSGIHRDIQRGITGRRNGLGGESIVLSQGYEDDVDLGDLIFYTGDGGRDRLTNRQVEDQTMDGRNATLAMNVDTEQPVRVSRRVSEGFRYDGLFRVEQAWMSPGKSGFRVCRFRLRRLRGGQPITSAGKPAQRVATTQYRLVRDSRVANQVKAIHELRCQVCGIRLDTAAGPYAEAAHIVPLGRGYDGRDAIENILCLCPNDHARFDHGALFVMDDLTIIQLDGTKVGTLKTHPDHPLDVGCLREHRAIFRRHPHFE